MVAKTRPCGRKKTAIWSQKNSHMVVKTGPKAPPFWVKSHAFWGLLSVMLRTSSGERRKIMRLIIRQMNAVIPDGANARYYLRRVRCQKSSCDTCIQAGGHGPYWYASWYVGQGRQGRRRQLLGRQRPVMISDEDAESVIARYSERQREHHWPTELPSQTRMPTGRW